MDDGHDEGPERRLSARAVFSLGLVTLMSGSILYHTLIAGPGRPLDLTGVEPADGATTKMVVDAGGMEPRTVTLSYDPVVEAVQRELRRSGFYAGAVDGVAGQKTRVAIETYESKNGLEVTGAAHRELIDHIRYTRELSVAADYTGSLPGAEGADGDVAGVQETLAKLGYEPGDDGELGDDTKAAIAQFEKDRGLKPTGGITEDMMDELAKLAGDTAE